MFNISRLSFSRALLYTSILTMIHSGTVLAGQGSSTQSKEDGKSTVRLRRNSRDLIEVRKQPVRLLEECALAKEARDLVHLECVINKMAPQMDHFQSVFKSGVLALRGMGINGFGSSLIVWDSEFERDEATNVIFTEEHPYTEKEKEIAHGTIIGAIAASKHPKSDAVAYGATVLPIVCARLPKKLREINKNLGECGSKVVKLGEDLQRCANELASCSQEKLACQKENLTCYEEMASLAGRRALVYQALSNSETDSEKMKQLVILIEQESVLKERMNVLNEKVGELSAKYAVLSQRRSEISSFLSGALESQSKVINSCREELEIFSQTLKTKKNLDTITDDTLDYIEDVIAYCREKNLPVPRVINLSLDCDVRKEEYKRLLTRLTSILQQNDMILVIAAGNNMRDIVKEKGSRGCVSLESKLDEFPELLKHLLFVGISSNNKKNAHEWWSNRAGVLKEHTIFAPGSLFERDIFPIKVKKAVEGTSYAAPNVCGILLLQKYFPNFSMQKMKEIILRSAYKPDGYNDDILGQGGLNPLQVWIEALKEDLQMQTNGVVETDPARNMNQETHPKNG